MSATLLQMVNQVQAELNLAVSSTVINNPSQDVQQILALMNGSGFDLLLENEWQALAKEHNFYVNSVTTTGDCVTGSDMITNIPDTSGIKVGYTLTGFFFLQNAQVAEVIDLNTVRINLRATGTAIANQVTFSQTKYDMPADFETITNTTQWDKSKRWKLLGPETAQQWAFLTNGTIATGPRIRWRIFGDYFQIWPPGNTGDSLNFEYRSNGWVLSKDGVPQTQFLADDDTTLFNSRVMVLSTKMKYFSIKGFDATVLKADYDRYLSIWKANDKGAANLSFAPTPNSILIGYGNLQDSNFPSGVSF